MKTELNFLLDINAYVIPGIMRILKQHTFTDSTQTHTHTRVRAEADII